MKTYLTIVAFFITAMSGLNAQSLKIMSYNIHVGQDASNTDQLKGLARFLKSTKADLIGLQEVDSMCNRSGKVDQMKFLAEETGMYYAYARHFAYDGGSYGIGILSRYPLTEVKDQRIILTSDGRSDAATRALLTASLSYGNNKITFATVHLDYRDSDSRFAQSKEIINLFKSYPTPVVLTGDFNARPGTREVTNLESIFTDTGDGSLVTFPALKPLNKIDYILISKGHLLKVKKNQVFPVLYSDHLPVMSVIKIRQYSQY